MATYNEKGERVLVNTSKKVPSKNILLGRIQSYENFIPKNIEVVFSEDNYLVTLCKVKTKLGMITSRSEKQLVIRLSPGVGYQFYFNGVKIKNY